MALENKLGITDSATLARTEEKLSKEKAVKLFEHGILDKQKAGSFKALAEIHKYLFEEIYDFAGKIRTVNIAKGGFRFAPVMYLESSLENIEKMPQSDFDAIVEKYVEMNIAHPFREGNGRSMRIWLDMMFRKELSMAVDWSRIDKEDYLLAMERSPIRDIEIKHLLKNALTADINDYPFSGSVTIKFVPFPYCDSTRILPLHSSTIRLTSGKPSPFPSEACALSP